jgi:hypothetical protein
MAATVIILMAIAWFVMTWVAKRWPLLRGLTVSGAPSALGLSLPFGFDNYAAFC